MLARQCLLRRLLYPSLLEFPPSRRGSREEAVRSTSNGALLRRRLDRDPHIRLSPRQPCEVRPRLMPREHHRGGHFPRGSVRFRMGFGGNRLSGSISLIPHDSHPRRRCLDRCHHPEEEGNLATW